MAATLLKTWYNPWTHQKPSLVTDTLVSTTSWRAFICQIHLEFPVLYDSYLVQIMVSSDVSAADSVSEWIIKKLQHNPGSWRQVNDAGYFWRIQIQNNCNNPQGEIQILQY